jgi:hypothetical protein
MGTLAGLPVRIPINDDSGRSQLQVERSNLY